MIAFFSEHHSKYIRRGRIQKGMKPAGGMKVQKISNIRVIGATNCKMTKNKGHQTRHCFLL
jgi:hypothetical protein